MGGEVGHEGRGAQEGRRFSGPLTGRRRSCAAPGCARAGVFGSRAVTPPPGVAQRIGSRQPGPASPSRGLPASALSRLGALVW